MDGFGLAPLDNNNAIHVAATPNLDKIFASNPFTAIGASGMDVGLPDGQMGNSEVGHTNIGAGRVVYQELTRITKSIKDGDFFENAGVKLITLTDYEAVLEAAKETGYITEEVMPTLQEWRANPSEWRNDLK